jgi:hypothetical protein
MSIYTVLADMIVVVHLAYVSYVILGQFAILVGWPLRWQWIRNPWFRISHLVMILIVAAEALAQYTCPLTTWESALRELAAERRGERRAEVDPIDDIEEASFIGRFANRVLMCDHKWGRTLRIGYYTFAGVAVATLLLAPPRFRGKVQAQG